MSPPLRHCAPYNRPMTPRLALRHGWLGLAIALACTPDPADEPEPGSTGLLPGSTSAASSTGAADSTSGVGSTTRADEGSTSNSTASDSSDGGVLFDLGGTPDAGPMPGMCAPEVPMIAAVPCDPADVVIVPPFDLHYDCLELPVIPDVPSSHGGVSFHHSDPDLLLIGGSANTAAGELYSIRITRDADCHVTGLADAQAQVYSEAAYNDGGVDYGPDS